MTEPITNQQLDEIVKMPRAEDIDTLVAEVRRLRARVTELEARFLPKLCECGHTRLVHTVPAPHGCFAGQIRDAEPCDCGEYRQLSFAEAERRIAERHAVQAEQQAAVEETHVVADDSDDPEHADDCPGCTRPCGHDDYHDTHEWADRPGVWCPGISYADDQPAARSAAV